MYFDFRRQLVVLVNSDHCLCSVANLAYIHVVTNLD